VIQLVEPKDAARLVKLTVEPEEEEKKDENLEEV
jgi:hypothetical protein